MCYGVAHHAKRCLLLKDMDRFAKKTHLLKFFWGEMKAEYIKTAVAKKVAKT